MNKRRTLTVLVWALVLTAGVALGGDTQGNTPNRAAYQLPTVGLHGAIDSRTDVDWFVTSAVVKGGLVRLKTFTGTMRAKGGVKVSLYIAKGTSVLTEADLMLIKTVILKPSSPAGTFLGNYVKGRNYFWKVAPAKSGQTGIYRVDFTVAAR